MQGVLAVMTALLLLTGGCAAQDGLSSPAPVESADAPTTPRALAWLASEHLGEPRLASPESDAAEEFAGDAVGTELSYDQQIVLAVGRNLPARHYDCELALDEGVDGCATTDEGVLLWELAVPEEDPGVVYVVVPKGDSAVIVWTSGPQEVTGDPRNLDLPIGVDDLFAVAVDPRVDVTTTPEAIRGGKNIDYWGPPDL